jgi:SAM-dependent methyltransferase
MNKIKDFSENCIYLYSCMNKINIEKANLLFKDLIRYYGSNKDERERYNPLLSIEEKWYLALNNGEIDYSVYGDEYYFIDLMACYWVYSKNYISNLNKKVFENKTKTINERFDNIDSVLDIGCGLGYTTKDLIKLFPNAKVFASNIKDTPQWYHCIEVIDEDAKLIDENTLLNDHVDLIFASEFFEHIENPIEYLSYIITKNSPNILVIANSFNTKSIGHFYNYKVNGAIVNSKNISRVFNNALRDFGYTKVKTSLWNDKPTIWTRNEP